VVESTLTRAVVPACRADVGLGAAGEPDVVGCVGGFFRRQCAGLAPHTARDFAEVFALVDTMWNPGQS